MRKKNNEEPRGYDAGAPQSAPPVVPTTWLLYCVRSGKLHAHMLLLFRAYLEHYRAAGMRYHVLERETVDALEWLAYVGTLAAFDGVSREAPWYGVDGVVLRGEVRSAPFGRGDAADLMKKARKRAVEDEVLEDV